MLKLLLPILLFTSIGHAQSPQCRELFVGPTITSATRNALSELPILLDKNKAKRGVRTKIFLDADAVVFKQILSLKEAELSEISTNDLIDIFGVFARWNLIPPAEFHNQLFNVLLKRLGTWTFKNHTIFAEYRKLTPAPISPEFLKSLKIEILKIFPKLKGYSQLEILSTEIFQLTNFTIPELTSLLEQTTASLRNTTETYYLKQIKETYRALRFLRATQPTFFYSAILKLEIELEKQMKKYGLSFAIDGTSGAINSDKGISSEQVQIEMALNVLLESAEKIYEFSDPALLGFYDPVDVLYVERHLVLEFDGTPHYFKNISFDEKGRLITEGGVLRPLDRNKDIVLRLLGYDVLRISYTLYDQLDTIEDLPAFLEQLIKQQNPQRSQ